MYLTIYWWLIMRDVYLLSYPRSGNFWTRYIIEFISKRPTQGYDSELDGPIGARHNLGVDLSAKPIVIKSHAEVGGPDDGIIMILRDYKEAITRHAKSSNLKTPQEQKEHFIQETQGSSNQGVDYISIIETYDKFPGNKMFIYYEDLITNPGKEISKIVKFLQLDEKNLRDFLSEYSIHHERSASSYHAGSYTRGKNIHYHISSLSNDYISFMDDYIKNLHPKIYEQYLKRYR